MVRLMIVEDEPLERMALRKIIQRSFPDIQMMEDARNGTEALRNTRLHKPHIILMDIRMPETDGLEVQREIHRAYPLIKTIILTAYSDFHYAREAIRYGVLDYLLKPVPPQELEQSIRKALDAIHDNGRHSEAGDNELEAPRDELLHAALDYIEEHIKSDLKLADVAACVHLNDQYFSRFFKSKMGMTFTEYVTRQRIRQAKILLAGSDLPIYRIAAEAGFSDASYFTKVFCKYERQTPNQFKKSIEL